MDESERLRLRARTAEFRDRAALARDEAALRGAAWWGHGLLQQTADYYDRRADDVERQLLGARRPGTAAPTAGARTDPEKA